MNLPEYENNLYIAGLPPIEGPGRTLARLSRPPSWEEANSELPPVMRRYCVQRLKRYFRPYHHHLLFAEEFGMLLRNGYMGRDPSERRHEARAITVADQAHEGLLLAAGQPLGFENCADSAVLVGIPGMGKTSTVREVLRSYPQVIEHKGLPPQIVWIKLDTPANGSLRALCIAFFNKVDGLLGQSTYTRLFTSPHTTEDAMMSNMALVANYHALGCLVIDEIQHLPKGGQADHQLLSFLVTLTNKMGVPVLFIGTMKAMRLFERTARMARRSVGNVGGSWENYAADSGAWKDFLEDLWQYQWTRGRVHLDAGMRSVMYEETQGVVDLAVKLFMRVQTRTIIRTEGEMMYPELIDAAFIRKVANDDFKPVQGFLDALRSGDRERIDAFEDLSSFDKDFRKTSAQLLSPIKVALSTPQRRDEGHDEVAPEVGSNEKAIRADLSKRGYETDMIDSVIAEVRADGGDADASLSTFILKIEKLLSPKAKRGAASPLPIEKLVDGDLRAIARDAAGSGRLVREAMEDAGIGGAAALKLAA